MPEMLILILKYEVFASISVHKMFTVICVDQIIGTKIKIVTIEIKR